jgi:hypothetical protein
VGVPHLTTHDVVWSILDDLLRMQGVQPHESDFEYEARGGYKQLFQQSA